MNETAAKVHIRWMVRRDLPEVLEIEQASFEFFWNEEDFLLVLRQRNCIGMVAEHNEYVIGYMIYTLEKTKFELLNFAVHPQWRRLGVGARMAEKMRGKVRSGFRNKITVNVRETNTPAQLFFHSQGFKALRVLRNHYLDSSEEAYQFVYRFSAEGDLP